jgi:hypothetical protein
MSTNIQVEFSSGWYRDTGVDDIAANRSRDSRKDHEQLFVH